MPSGRAHGIDRDYQILARDILTRMAQLALLEPYSGDGIDVPIKLGSAIRTFDVALKDHNNQLVVAECKRTRAPIKLTDLDAFAHRVELLRRETNGAVAGVYFAKTAYQLGAIKAAPDSGIRVALCAQDQPPTVFGLMFERYDPDRERRIRDGQVFINAGLQATAEAGTLGVHVDGTQEDTGSS